MTTKVWTKKVTQKVIKDLRKGGYKVRKEDFGDFATYYIVDDDTNKVWKKDGRDLFKAMDIGNGYLINFHPSLWQREF